MTSQNFAAEFSDEICNIEKFRDVFRTQSNI